MSVRHCAKKYGVEPKNIRDWRRQVQKIRASDAGAKCIGSGRKPDWPEMEYRLHELFTEWRRTGRRVDHRWFFRNGKAIFEECYPQHVALGPDGQKKYTLKYVYLLCTKTLSIHSSLAAGSGQRFWSDSLIDLGPTQMVPRLVRWLQASERHRLQSNQQKTFTQKRRRGRR